MESHHLLIASVILVIAVIIIWYKPWAESNNRVKLAKERAYMRELEKTKSVPFADCIILMNDPSELSDQQRNIIALTEAGFVPEVKKDTYKYIGKPLTQVAGVPENYGKE
jgi:hypothetical protein